MLSDRAPQQVRVALVRHEPRRVLVEIVLGALLLLEVRLRGPVRLELGKNRPHLVARHRAADFAALQRLRVGVGGDEGRRCGVHRE